MDFRPLAMIVGGAFFMEQLDTTIIAPAIPAMALDLGVEPLRLNLALTVYLLCLVVFIPISGAVADRFGTRTVFCRAVACFIASSAICGLAQDIVILTLARAVQGASGALMVPVGRMAIVRAAGRGQLVRALAWMMTPAMLGPVLGPPLGGLIVTYGSWPWIFYINIPVGLLGVWLAARHMPQFHGDGGRGRFDLVGWMLLAVCLTLCVVALELVARHGTAASVVLSSVGGVLAALGYGLHVRRIECPLLDFSLLDIQTFRASFINGAVVRVGYGALPFLLPLALQIGLGFSAMESGFALLMSALTVIVMKTQVAPILRRFGFRRVLLWNGLVCGVALACCALFQGLMTISIVLLIGGFSRSVQFNAITAIGYADIVAERVGAATSLNTTFQQLAAMLGISLSVVIIELCALADGRGVPQADDFAIALMIMGFIALAGLPWFWHLPADAGEELSGYRRSVARRA
ncbi:MAG: MFS transporter [Azoarcus sp.]|nr:MFS transporter [Azoarcus sp.]